jgi:acetyl-CoA carboxylase biotin carboxylase subunit
MNAPRLLIANRGEIAVRIIRACRDLGISPVAVYSEADRGSLHVRLADHAVAIGPPPARESYLVPEKLIAAARKTGASLVHPGFGFLSENAAFAQAVIDAGLTWVGPRPFSIGAMGSKTESRQRMLAAGVPVVPGMTTPAASAAEVAAFGRENGFPLLLKAAAGGGGKGMRVVRAESEVAEAFARTQSEAKSYFADDRVYAEVFVEHPRHIEVQILGDMTGKVLAIGERECSLQRRHQKVLEECPSAAVSPELRAKMEAVAVAAAKAVEYVSAGTVEFLLAKDGRFFFLEMNTRIQVEHPVTECVYGVDLVAEMIRIALGKPISFAEKPAARGHAIECRVYAEDPVKFLPSPGTITHLRVPDGPYVRNDSGCYEGAEIPVHYDPMISKLVVWGEDRARALARMRRALDEYQVRGIETNLAFHRRCVRHAAFAAGDYDTGFIGRHAKELAPQAGEAELTAAIIAVALDATTTAAPARVQVTRPGATAEPSGWRRLLR